MAAIVKNHMLVITVLISLFVHAGIFHLLGDLPGTSESLPNADRTIEISIKAVNTRASTPIQTDQQVQTSDIAQEKTQHIQQPQGEKPSPIKSNSKPVKQAERRTVKKRAVNPAITNNKPAAPADTENNPAVKTRPRANAGKIQETADAVRQRYINRLLALVSENKFYPRRSRRKKEEGLVKISLVVKSDGSIQNVQVAQSSGVERLDNAALQTVRSIDNAGRFPEQMPPISLSLLVPMNYELR
jgi:TonB family protein